MKQQRRAIKIVATLGPASSDPALLERDQALHEAESHLKARGIVQSGDVYAITAGEPVGAPGGTNMLKTCRVA